MLYESVRTLPIVSPHGHTNAAWFARNEPFPDPAKLFVQPDHYIFRMLYSQGVSLEDLEIGQPKLKDARKVWRIFASHYYLFRAGAVVGPAAWRAQSAAHCSPSSPATSCNCYVILFGIASCAYLSALIVLYMLAPGLKKVEFAA